MAIIMGTGSFFLALSLCLNVIALLVPYWEENGRSNKGLWGECTCSWYFEQGFDTNKPDWFKSVQGLYAAAVVIIIAAVIIVFIIGCCTERQGGTGMLAAGVLLAIAATAIVVALVIFGAYGSEELHLKVDDFPRFGWGMWLAVSGAFICLVASIIHIQQGRPKY